MPGPFGRDEAALAAVGVVERDVERVVDRRAGRRSSSTCVHAYVIGVSPSGSVAAPFIVTVPWVLTLLIVCAAPLVIDRAVVRVDVDDDGVFTGVEAVVDAEPEGQVERAAARSDEPLVRLERVVGVVRVERDGRTAGLGPLVGEDLAGVGVGRPSRAA